MHATYLDLTAVLDRVNDATVVLRSTPDVPDEVADLIDGLETTLGVAAPRRVHADPYLTSALWAAAYRAEKALRHDDAAKRRRDVRVALEQLRHALRDLTERRPYDDDVPARQILVRTGEILAAPQPALAELLGVSVRQLQRWLSESGSEPAAGDAARIRIVGQLVNQLRHTFTGPGVLTWFHRKHPMLRRKPAELLDDPLAYPKLLDAAVAARAMTA